MRQLAVTLRKRWQAGDAEALAEASALHPKFASGGAFS